MASDTQATRVQGQGTKSAPQQTRQRPVQELRLGRVKASVWANEVEGVVRHNVTLSRLYKDGEQWKTTEAFGRDDLLILAKLLDLAHTWISGQKQHGEEIPC